VSEVHSKLRQRRRKQAKYLRIPVTGIHRNLFFQCLEKRRASFRGFQEIEE
jgi:hypothetical protein